jgi:dihydroorotate dehydrogenase subfamily 1
MSVFFLGRRLSGRFVTPSGILTTRTGIIDRVIRTIPEIGVITTKSVGVEPEPGYREPILAEDSPLNFVNAIGLRSPGMVAMREELSELRTGLIENSGDGKRDLMADRFLLVSIFGKTEEEFRTLVRYLAPVADGIELNLSCPHSKPGYGASIGSHPDTTFSFTQAAVEASREKEIERPSNAWTNFSGHLPIFVKLTPNVDDIGIIAEAAIRAGATGITAINTVGPIEHRDPVSGKPVLTHVTGGKSGQWVLETGARCVNRIREVVGDGIPIIGMGGIATSMDVARYQGADLYGVGSVLAGLDIDGIARFFRTLESDIEYGSLETEDFLNHDRLMEYRPFRISEVIEKDDDLRIFVLDGALEFDPAQFVFLWFPGVGEKPFSPAGRDPLRLAIRKRGIFTEKLFELEPGDTIFVRGPYGRGFWPDICENLIILTGGTGSGVALRLAEEAVCRGASVKVYQGSVNDQQVLFEHEFRKHGRFIPGIDSDRPGEVLRIMEKHMDLEVTPTGESRFFTIGPEILMREGMKIFSKYASDDHIYASVERETLCGVGLCGACELNGYRTCIRGTVVSLRSLKEMKHAEGLL